MNTFIKKLKYRIRVSIPDERQRKKTIIKGAVSILVILIALLFFGEKGESKGKTKISSFNSEKEKINSSSLNESSIEETSESSSNININTNTYSNDSKLNDDKGFIIYSNDNNSNNNNNITNNENALNESSNQSEATENHSIICDISGAVVNPGVYELSYGQRLNDLIELAGGLNDDADVNRINRARIVSDSEKVYIPSIDEDNTIAYSNSIESNDSGLMNSGNTYYSNGYLDSSINNNNINNINKYSGMNGTSGSGFKNGLVDINHATSEELQTIKGIGPSTAEKIIAYREENGGFDRIEELMNVSGIGEKTFKKMKDFVTV